MPTVEERLASLEGRVSENSHTFVAMRDSLSLLRDSVTSLERRMDRFEQRVDGRFDAIDRRFEAMDRKFGWLIALFITSTIAIIGTILTR